jgi:general stress protein 26
MSQEELKNKIIAFAKTYEYSNLITIGDSGIPKGRMMENLPLEDDLVFWFATGAQSNKVQEIKNNPKTSVFLYRPEDHSSISALGKAEIVTDDNIRKEKWKDKWSSFWEGGPADPAYRLIKIVPEKIIYLDFPNHSQEVLEL